MCTYNCSVLIALLYRYYTGRPYFTQVIYGSTSFCLPLLLRLINKTLLGRLYNSDIFIEADFGGFFFRFLFFCINITLFIFKPCNLHQQQFIFEVKIFAYGMFFFKLSFSLEKFHKFQLLILSISLKGMLPSSTFEDKKENIS